MFHCRISGPIGARNHIVPILPKNNMDTLQGLAVPMCALCLQLKTDFIFHAFHKLDSRKRPILNPRSVQDCSRHLYVGEISILYDNLIIPRQESVKGKLAKFRCEFDSMSARVYVYDFRFHRLTRSIEATGVLIAKTSNFTDMNQSIKAVLKTHENTQRRYNLSDRPNHDLADRICTNDIIPDAIDVNRFCSFHLFYFLPHITDLSIVILLFTCGHISQHVICLFCVLNYGSTSADYYQETTRGQPPLALSFKEQQLTATPRLTLILIYHKIERPRKGV